MLRIALAQLDYHIGNFEANTQGIIEAIEKAKTAGADLVVFAELAVCGYPPLDFLDYPHFIGRSLESLNEIATHCKGIAAIVGCPTPNPAIPGKNLFNSACYLEDGAVKSIVAKTLLPTYDVFDEYRWFEPGNGQCCIHCKGVRIALTVCEDLWNMGDDPLYTDWPMSTLISEKPALMINIAASPFSYRQSRTRQDILQKNVGQYKLPLVYVNQTGAHTDLIFDGDSVAYNASAQPVLRLARFSEEMAYVDFDPHTGDFKASPLPVHDEPKISAIHRALICGIQGYFQKMGFKEAILGMSGGIDSALVLALACEALGAENVKAVMMPSPFSSEHSVSDSRTMINSLACMSELIPIESTYSALITSLDSAFMKKPFDVTEENIQARIRGLMLMALSNKHGYILLNTSNKSELAVGYGTLYGDMCGGLSVIGDLYKTEVYELARYINRNGEIIPESIITKAPSAELRPGQLDSDSLPPYDLLDRILFEYIEEAKGPDAILSEGYDEVTVMRILRMVNRNEYKRFQFAPILRVSTKAFGRGRRMPLVAQYLG